MFHPDGRPAGALAVNLPLDAHRRPDLEDGVRRAAAAISDALAA